jgi:quercetin 2,3-dioxygenase
MSAGTGMRHSEFNLGQDLLTLFQIWLRPRQPGEPHWDTRRLPKADRANQLIVLASGFPEAADALPIGADALILGCDAASGLGIDLYHGRSSKRISCAGVGCRDSDR